MLTSTNTLYTFHAGRSFARSNEINFGINKSGVAYNFGCPRAFSLGLRKVCKKLWSKLLIFKLFLMPIFCGSDNLLGRQIWTMSKFNLLGAQMINWVG